MKIRRVRKQGKVQIRQRARSGLSGMPIIDRRSLSVKTKKEAITMTTAIELNRMSAFELDSVNGIIPTSDEQIDAITQSTYNDKIKQTG